MQSVHLQPILYSKRPPFLQNKWILSRKRMLSPLCTSLATSPLCCLVFSVHDTPKIPSQVHPFNHVFSSWNSFRQKLNQDGVLPVSISSPSLNKRNRHFICCCTGQDFEQKDGALEWPILKRWDVPWQWQTISLASLACGLSFLLTGLIETVALPYLGLQITELSLDEKAELLFVDQAITTAVVLAVLYGITKSFEGLSKDVYYYDLREPFNLQRGWLLWAGIGIVGAVISVALTGAALSYFSGGTPERETDALAILLPLIGSSTTSTACLVGIAGVLAPVLEENVFRGFLMVSLTKWLPTPVSVIVSAAVFAIAHLTPSEFPQLFVLGTALGLTYAQTRNLLTPITIHALWNSGVILILTFLELQGYDIKQLIQGS